MVRWVDGWVKGWEGGWVDGRVGGEMMDAGKVGGCVGEYVDRWIGRWMGWWAAGWMEVWVGRWVNAWMDRWGTANVRMNGWMSTRFAGADQYKWEGLRASSGTGTYLTGDHNVTVYWALEPCVPLTYLPDPDSTTHTSRARDTSKQGHPVPEARVTTST